MMRAASEGVANKTEPFLKSDEADDMYCQFLFSPRIPSWKRRPKWRQNRDRTKNHYPYHRLKPETKESMLEKIADLDRKIEELIKSKVRMIKLPAPCRAKTS
jgi:hypothetical protein